MSAAEGRRLEELRIDRSAAPARGSGLLWILLAVVVAGAAGGWWALRPRAAEVRTAVARAAATASPGGATVLNATGYVTARRMATVSSKVTGKVVEVLIEEGMEVAEGQVLARLDTSNVAASLRLAGAQLVAARSALAETEALLREAELDLGRTRELVREEVSTQAALDRAVAGRDSLAARLVRQRGEAGVAAERVALWRQEMEDRVIRAPFAGVVVDKNAQPGEMISPVSAGGGFTRTGIGTIVDMSSLEVEVDVNESYINRVRPGQAVTATIDAYPEWPIPSRVIAIVPTADRQRATVQVRIGFDQLDERILPDMGVKVAFQGERSEEAPRSRPQLLVPSDAVLDDGGRAVVFVVRDGRVERRAVTTAGGGDGEVAIAAGLAAGEEVVVGGPATLADGDAVEVVR